MTSVQNWWMAVSKGNPILMATESCGQEVTRQLTSLVSVRASELIHLRGSQEDLHQAHSVGWIDYHNSVEQGCWCTAQRQLSGLPGSQGLRQGYQRCPVEIVKRTTLWDALVEPIRGSSLLQVWSGVRVRRLVIRKGRVEGIEVAEDLGNRAQPGGAT